VGNDVTYWAWWVRNLTVNYEILVNVNSSAARNHANASVSNEVRQLFLHTFGVNLVQVPSGPRFESSLNDLQLAPILPGTVDTRNAANVLSRVPSNRNTIRFRFVNYQLRQNNQPVRGMAWQVSGANGAQLGDMVVRTHENPTTPVSAHELRFVIVHEISHIFGAFDCIVLGCFMGFYNPNRSSFFWCNRCIASISSYLNLRAVSHPELRR